MTATAIATVLGGRKILKRKVESDADLRGLTRDGVPVSTLTLLADEFAIDRKTIASVLGISDRTLSRRLAHAERLTAEESDRLIRLARVFAMTKDTLGNSQKAASWLQRKNIVLEGQTPLSLLDTDSGVRAVEEVLNRIEYGLYS